MITKIKRIEKGITNPIINGEFDEFESIL